MVLCWALLGGMCAGGAKKAGPLLDELDAAVAGSAGAGGLMNLLAGIWDPDLLLAGVGFWCSQHPFPPQFFW